MAKKIVILGGGVAGTIVANQLARKIAGELRSKSVSITQIGNTDTHTYQPGWLYIPFDLSRPEDLKRPQKSLLDSAIDFVQDEIANIDIKGQKLTSKGGREYGYDILVIATGSVPRPDLTPGLIEAGHWFHTEEGSIKLRDALRSFAGGKIVISMGVPHKCPVAPVEVTLMLDDYLKKRGLRDKTEITYTYPVGAVHTIPAVAKWGAQTFDERGIKYEVFFNMKEVDVKNKIVHSMEGSQLPFDLLITIPQHRGAQVILDSKLGEGGWIPTNKETLQMEGTENVFVVGDTTNLPISKAGSTAHFSADVLVENVVDLLSGQKPSHKYDGKVFCFIETGRNQASYISFNYTTPPSPPTPTTMVHWLKISYNKMYWLTSRGIL
ncbi:MAG: NAD(P)/FAD-dependent oxidoreductase [Nitrospirae bacterium]|nr:NAD(P)/FAD-dependent oxidoreductase [Nitrospirota bacterium]